MAMTKQRKILAGVMALGLGALVLDRLVLGPPEQASASQPLAPAAGSAVPDPAPPDTQGLQPEAAQDGLPSFETLSQRLASASGPRADSPADDPFALPDGWQSAAPRTPTATPIDQSKFAEKLRADYRLSGISKSGNEHLAVINGLPIRLGQVVKLEIEGESVTFVLVQIDNNQRQAVWQSRSSGERVVMAVPGILD